MESFDIYKKRKILDGDCGINFRLKRDYLKFASGGGLASCAHHDMICAIYCYLVDYDEPAFELLAKAHNWLQEAIENEEHPHRYTANYTEAFRYCNMAFVNWLISGEHDSLSLEKYIEHVDRYLDQEVKVYWFSVNWTNPFPI